jgi:hypothetical protein
LRSLRHGTKFQICDALLKLLDYFFKLGHLLGNSFFISYFYEGHREKCSVDLFLDFQLFRDQLLVALL